MTLAQSIITDNTLFLVWAGLPLFLGACSIYRSFGPYVGRCRKREREGALRVGEKENKTPSLGYELTLEHCPSLSLSLSLSLPLFLSFSHSSSSASAFLFPRCPAVRVCTRRIYRPCAVGPGLLADATLTFYVAASVIFRFCAGPAACHQI